MAFKPTRRDVLKASVVAAAGLAAGPKAFAQARRGANERLRFAMIGVGGRGGAHLKPAAEFGDIVALCDIDAATLTKTLADYPKAAAFADFRAMLDTMSGQIDAVVVATPDHVHAPASAMAMKLGKHVYCEKPLTRTLGEARKLQEIARRARVATQMGNQGTSSDDLRNAVAVIQTGMFGKVKEIHCWTDRSGGWWPQGVERPEPKPTPGTVAWDLWLGPSPERPYAPGYHPFAWRGWWDFGSGALGDIGCHCMNLPFWALDLREPSAVQAETSGHNKDSYPSWSIVKMEFPERGGRPPLTLTWYDSGKKPPAELGNGETLGGNGCLIVCDHATLHAPGEYGSNCHIAGGGGLPLIEFEKSPGHFKEFVIAATGGPRAKGDIVAYSGPLTETVLMGNLAVWASGERLEWDARRLRVKGRPEFDSVIHPAYREGWML